MGRCPGLFRVLELGDPLWGLPVPDPLDVGEGIGGPFADGLQGGAGHGLASTTEFDVVPAGTSLLQLRLVARLELEALGAGSIGPEQPGRPFATLACWSITDSPAWWILTPRL